MLRVMAQALSKEPGLTRSTYAPRGHWCLIARMPWKISHSSALISYNKMEFKPNPQENKSALVSVMSSLVRASGFVFGGLELWFAYFLPGQQCYCFSWYFQKVFIFVTNLRWALYLSVKWRKQSGVIPSSSCDTFWRQSLMVSIACCLRRLSRGCFKNSCITFQLLWSSINVFY